MLYHSVVYDLTASRGGNTMLPLQRPPCGYLCVQFVYWSFRPEAPTHYPETHALVTGRQPFGLLSRELVQHFSTVANMRFTICSLAVGDHRDVFSDMLAPYYNSDVWTSTFMKSKGVRGASAFLCVKLCPKLLTHV